MIRSEVKRIAVLTSGGDSCGMNAAIRSVVRTGIYYGLKVYGVFYGYEGLINNDLKELDRRSVSGIVNRGGTILKTARSERFRTESGQKKAVHTLKKNKIDGLVVIGGDGSFQGAHVLAKDWGVKCVGVPGTIDNDIEGTDYTIGSDTALSVALDAIDKIRDTVTSLERIFVIEVMGRESGYIAMRSALAGGAEDVLLPDVKFDMDKICEEIKAARAKGKVSWILVVAEGAAKAQEIADIISKNTSYETRISILGHIQRGGTPTFMDRILASRLGAAAVKLLLQGDTDKMVGIVSDQVEVTPLEYATRKGKEAYKNLYELLKILEA
ncbi:MAG: 6-phosphofructokinase [Candidatus Omnitrophota bacterium]